MVAVINPRLGTDSVLAVTALQSLASSSTVGWKSALVDNTTTLALDYEVYVSLTTANTAPANDKAVYVYICAAHKDNGGTFRYSDGGTTTLPASGDASYTIAGTSLPNNLDLLAVLPYVTQQQFIQKVMNLSSIYGLGCMPDGFLVIVVNFTGAAFTAAVVEVRPSDETIT